MKKISTANKQLLLELEEIRSKKLIWGLLNIFLFGWLLVPLIIGIIQLLEIPKINRQIMEIKLG